MSEILTPVLEENVGDPTATSWPMDFSQPFHDTIGVNGPFGTYAGFQIFTATLNGTTYVLSTVIMQVNVASNGSVVISMPVFLHP
jgi:hypothetical protein